MSSESIDPRRLCQIEIHVTDLKRSLTFYLEAFGWQKVPADIHNYTVLEVPRDCHFGISLIAKKTAAATESKAPSQQNLVLYFKVDDPESIVKKAVVAGGKKHFGPQKIDGHGLIYQISDPDGNRFGIFKEDRPQP
jgi:predicted enzyme related to lactoylglutathione lyase